MLTALMVYGHKVKNVTMETSLQGMVALYAEETQTITVLTSCCNRPSAINAHKIVNSAD